MPSSSGLELRVEAGRFGRRDTPVRVDLSAGSVRSVVGEPVRESLPGFILRETRRGQVVGEPMAVQAEPLDGAGKGSVRLTWILAGETPPGTSRTFRFEPAKTDANPSPWRLSTRRDGLLDVTNGGRTVFRYNAAPSSHPNFGKILTRNAYIHPAFTPSGALITGDFSRFHPHHRGFFLAYTKTQVGRLHPDFWNIQGGTGKICFEHLESPFAGPVTGRFTAHHRWEVADGTAVLRERWDIEAYDIPGQPYWRFDLTSTQQAAAAPLELLPYRYGGMAYRGPEPFVKGALDVLTSEGRGRLAQDQKPARWVDLTGPVADGSNEYAGAMIADHPDNVPFPTVARIHPTLLPFFCYVPAHDKAVTITADKPTVFRYRILIHDGRPDGERNEQLWRDFAEPPRVTPFPTSP